MCNKTEYVGVACASIKFATLSRLVAANDSEMLPVSYGAKVHKGTCTNTSYIEPSIVLTFHLRLMKIMLHRSQLACGTTISRLQCICQHMLSVVTGSRHTYQPALSPVLTGLVPGELTTVCHMITHCHYCNIFSVCHFTAMRMTV